MDKQLAAALAAAARGFADALEAAVAGATDTEPAPAAGSPESMRLFLRRIKDVNDLGRGATKEEASRFAREAGMDPRGAAGYYTGASQLLEERGEARWITETGVTRLERLDDVLNQD